MGVHTAAGSWLQVISEGPAVVDLMLRVAGGGVGSAALLLCVLTVADGPLGLGAQWPPQGDVAPGGDCFLMHAGAALNLRRTVISASTARSATPTAKHSTIQLRWLRHISTHSQSNSGQGGAPMAQEMIMTTM